jgi:hypothetical protein
MVVDSAPESNRRILCPEGRPSEKADAIAPPTDVAGNFAAFIIYCRSLRNADRDIEKLEVEIQLFQLVASKLNGLLAADLLQNLPDAL